jgi:hypothetical protein
METTTIKKSSNWYNPYYLDNKKIDAIVFYQNGKKVGQTNWFTDFGSNNRYPEVYLPETIKTKRKIDLFSKDSFLAKTTEDIDPYNGNYSLYLNLDNYYHTIEKLVPSHSDKYYNRFKDIMHIKLDALKDQILFDKETGEKSYIQVDDNYSIKVEMNFLSQRTKEQRKIEKLEKLFNDKNIGLSQWQIKQLKEICNISVKRNK